MTVFSRRALIKMVGYTAGASLLSPLLSFRDPSAMMQRAIPSTGEKLPVVGLGSWLQFDVGSAASERAPLKEVLVRMNQMGGRMIDSSPMYGRAEEVIGDLTTETGLADHFFYATKVWTTGREAGIAQMESSFRKMRRKTMDLMQVHNLTDYDTHLKTLNTWKKEGRIRYTGATHYAVSAHAALERLAKARAVDFLQFNYSIRVRNAEKSLLNAAMDNGIAVVINEPFDSGSLFGLVKGKQLPGWASDYAIKSWAQFFLKYILSHPAVTCVIPGTSDPAHLADNMGAGHGILPDEKGREKMRQLMEQLS